MCVGEKKTEYTPTKQSPSLMFQNVYLNYLNTSKYKTFKL